MAERLSSRQRKLLELQALEGPGQQAPPPDMMRQMLEMYGMAQADEQRGLQQQTQQLMNRKTQQEIDMAPADAELKRRLGEQNLNYLTQRAAAEQADATGLVTPRDRMKFEMTTGKPYVSSEENAAAQQAAMMKKWGTIEAQARSMGVDAGLEPDIMMNWGQENLDYLKSLKPQPAPAPAEVPFAPPSLPITMPPVIAPQPGTFQELLKGLFGMLPTPRSSRKETQKDYDRFRGSYNDMAGGF